MDKQSFNEVRAGIKDAGTPPVDRTNLIFIGLAAAVFVLVSITVPYFFTFRNISKLLVSASSTGIMAIGLTYVMIAGGIDLSGPPALAMSATLGCTVMVATGSVFLGIVVILAVSCGIGLLNGVAIGKLGMVPMVATLAIATMCSGFTNWFTKTQTVTGMPEAYLKIFAGTYLKTPATVYYFILICIIFHLVLKKTIFGRSLYAIGVNSRAAAVNGVNTSRTRLLTYLLAGLLYGFGAILASARLNAAGVSLGPQSNFQDVVTAVVLGGTSVAGGKGSIAGTFLGAVIIAIISNVMNLTNVNYFTTLIVKGSIILIVSYLDVIRNRRGEAR